MSAAATNKRKRAGAQEGHGTAKRTKKHKVPSVHDLKTSLLGNLDKAEVGKGLKLGRKYEDMYRHGQRVNQGLIAKANELQSTVKDRDKDIELLKKQNDSLVRKLEHQSTECEKMQTEYSQLFTKFQFASKNVKKFALERKQARCKLEEVILGKNKLIKKNRDLRKKCTVQRELGSKSSKAEIVALTNALEKEISDRRELEKQLETATKERDVLRQKWGGMQNAFSSLCLPALEDAVVSAPEPAVPNQECFDQPVEETEDPSDEDSDDESDEEEEEVEQQAVDVD